MATIEFISPDLATTGNGDPVYQELNICSDPDVFICTNMDSGVRDSNWSYSDSSQPVDGIGINGTYGWEHIISVGVANTSYFGYSGISGQGKIYSRQMIRFSSNYVFGHNCGLQKIGYHMFTTSGGANFDARTMLGACPINRVPGTIYSSYPATVGLLTYDLAGHVIYYPNENDAIPINVDTWYSVEIMTDYNSTTSELTVSIWIDGVLQQTKIHPTGESGYNGTGTYNLMRVDGWFGGADSCNAITEQQSVYKDNIIVSKSYIGPMTIL